MRRIATVFTIMFSVLVLSSSAWAAYIADITYDYVNNGGGNYTFNYTVANNSDLGDNAALDFFMIDFNADALASYSNITWNLTQNWNAYAFDFDPAYGDIPGTIIADDSIPFGSAGGGIARGASLGLFSVTFDYAGSLLADQQLFSYRAEFGTNEQQSGIETDFGYWIEGFDLGTTAYNRPIPPDPTTPVPEPATLFLLGSGLLGAAALKSRKNK